MGTQDLNQTQAKIRKIIALAKLKNKSPEKSLARGNEQWTETLKSLRMDGTWLIVISILSAIAGVFLGIYTENPIVTFVLFFCGLFDLILGVKYRSLSMTPNSLWTLSIIGVAINVCALKGILPSIAVIACISGLRRSRSYKEWYESMGQITSQKAPQSTSSQTIVKEREINNGKLGVGLIATLIIAIAIFISTIIVVTVNLSNK